MDKREQLLDWDQILGLGLTEAQTGVEVPEEVKKDWPENGNLCVRRVSLCWRMK